MKLIDKMDAGGSAMVRGSAICSNKSAPANETLPQNRGIL